MARPTHRKSLCVPFSGTCSLQCLKKLKQPKYLAMMERSPALFSHDNVVFNALAVLMPSEVFLFLFLMI